MSRKTFKVQELIDLVNYRNKNSKSTRDFRNGANAVLEIVLEESGNYNGFRYLTQDEVPEGELCGVILSEEEGNQFPDTSRRFYF